jgi:outer membrane protein assembly factor BamB
MANDTYRAAADRHLLVVFPAQHKTALGLDARSGEELWRTALPFAAMRYLITSEAIFVSAAGGEVCALSLDGELLWHNELGGLGLGVPLLAVPGMVPMTGGH